MLESVTSCLFKICSRLNMNCLICCVAVLVLCLVASVVFCCFWVSKSVKLIEVVSNCCKLFHSD